MMKKIIPVITLALVTLMASCNNKQKAVEVNDKLAHITRDIEAQGLKIQPVMQQCISDGDFAALAAPLKEAGAMIETKIKEATAVETIRGSEAYKQSVLDLLNLEKKIISEAFVPLTSLNRSTPQNELEGAFTHLQEVIKEEQGAIDKVRKAQADFAKEYGFTILN